MAQNTLYYIVQSGIYAKGAPLATLNLVTPQTLLNVAR